MPVPILTLTSDFGLTDHYVSVMKGVILGICPQARIVDISHGVSPFEIGEGAYLIAQAYPCFPKKTVHVVVVDPGVGSARRPILVEAGEPDVSRPRYLLSGGGAPGGRRAALAHGQTDSGLPAAVV